MIEREINRLLNLTIFNMELLKFNIKYFEILIFLKLL